MNDVDYAFKSFLISIPDGEGNYQLAAYPKPGYEDFQEGEQTESETEPETPTETETEPETPTEKETETEKKTEKESETPKTPDKPKLPQTGQLWWPVPLLIAAGIAFILTGALRRRAGKNR